LIGFEAEFAAQYAQPEDGLARRMVHDQENDLGSREHEGEQMVRAFT